MGGGRHPGQRGTPPPPQYTPPRLEPFEDVPPPQVTDRVTNRIEEREITLDGADGKRYIAYGKQKLAGKRQYWYVPPLAPNDLWLVKELCAGECDGVIGIEIIPGFTESIAAYAAGGVSLEIFWHPGTPAGEVDTHLAAVDPTWNEAFPGTCYVVEHYKGVGNYWIEIPDIVYEMRTRKCLDASNPTGPRIYSENAWDQWFDYVLWDEGKGLPLTRVNATSFVNAKAADIAASRSMDCHPLLMEKSSPDDVIKMFRIMTSAFWFPDGNQFLVVPDRAGSVVATYTDKDVEFTTPIAGSREDGLDRPNKVIGYYTEISGTAPRTKWQKSEPIVVQTDAARDGLEDPIEAEFDLQWTHDAAVCRSRLVYILNSYQFDAKLKERWRVTTADRQLGDIVTRDIPERGLSFTGRLMRRVKNILDGTCDVVLAEYNAARYSYDPVSVAPKTPSTLVGMYDPNKPEPPAGPVDTVDASGNHFLSWGKPPVRTPLVYGAGSWSQSGLSDFTASAIQDGNKTTHAARFNTTTNPKYIQLDTGSGGAAIREVILRIDLTDAYGINSGSFVRPQLGLYVSNSPTGPFTLAASATPAFPSGTSNAFWYSWQEARVSFAVASSVGSPRYWRIENDDANAYTAWINEVELYAYSGASYPYIRGYRLKGWKPNPQTAGSLNYAYPNVLKIVDLFVSPELAPVRPEDFAQSFRTHSESVFDGSLFDSAGTSFMLEVATISHTDVVSEFRTFYLGGVSSTSSTTGDADGINQAWLPLARQDVTLANTGNNDVNISRIVDVIRIIGPTADFTVTGFNHGYEGRIQILKNATAFKMTLSNNSGASSAANRFSFGRDVIVPAGGTIILFYNAQASLWERNESRLNAIYDDGSGNVGIGHAPANGKLDLKGNAWIENGSTDHALRIIPGTTGGLHLIESNYVSAGALLPIHISANGSSPTTPQLYLDTNGNIGMGVVPSYALDLRRDGGGGNVRVNLANLGTATGDDISVVFTTEASRVFVVGIDRSTGLFAIEPATAFSGSPPFAIDLTGNVTVATQAAGNNSTRIATTAYVQGELANYAPLASPALTGNPTAPTQAAGNNSTRIATTAYVQGELANYAPLASPTFTGDPKAPTPAAGDNDTSIATTAYVQGEIEHIIRKTSDSTFTTLATDSELAFSVAASGVYEFDAYIIWQSDTASGGGLAAGVTGPASPTAVDYLLAIQNNTSGTASTTTLTLSHEIGFGSRGIANAPVTSANLYARLTGVVVNGANSGTVAIQAQHNSVGTITIKAGSFIRWKKIG